MTGQKQIQNFFIIGLLIVALGIVSSIIVALIFLAPSALLALAGLPLWPLLLLSIPIGFVVLGWAVFTLGRFRRK